jgi:hypothetical protein
MSPGTLVQHKQAFQIQIQAQTAPTWHDTIFAVESEAGEVKEPADCSQLSI